MVRLKNIKVSKIVIYEFWCDYVKPKYGENAQLSYMGRNKKNQTFRKTLLEMLKLGGSGSGKKNSLFNLISHQPDIDKIYLYVKDPYEAKYQLMINKTESAGFKHLNDSEAFIKY